MKMRKNILALTLGTAFVLPMAFAQGPAPAQVNVSNAAVPAAITAQIAQGVVKDPGTGNKFEKEITPLLRDISKKRSQLEIRKLERELEKLDEDAAKAQAETQAKANANSNPSPGFVPVPTAQSPSTMNTMQGGNSHDFGNSVRVLMIYGNLNNLYAKISLGDQGGYPVRKGDILPDGRLVTNVTLNYIEVKEVGKKKSTPEIIPVKGPLVSSDSGSNSNANNNLNNMSLMPTALPPSIFPTPGAK